MAINDQFFKTHNITLPTICENVSDSSIKLDKLFLVSHSTNFLSEGKNNKFFKIYWQTFANKFYFCFYKKNFPQLSKIEMIALPSNKKVKLFFKLFNLKNYIVQIIANEEVSDLAPILPPKTIKPFSPSNKNLSCWVLFILSVYGNAAQGLNLPNLFYLNLSLDNYKPKHTYFREIIPLNNTYTSPEFDIIQKSLIQITGRITRREHERKKQVKIIEYNNKAPYSDMHFNAFYYPLLTQYFQKIYIIDF